MDASAIKQIADMSAASSAIFHIENNPDLIIPLAVIPDNHKLLNLEQYQEKPDRFRGRFGTRLIEEFISYINDNATESTGIFINSEEATAKAIINMGHTDSPQWGDHEATLILKETPAFHDLLRHKDSKLDQQGFIDFAEDWVENIQFIDDKYDELAFKSAINAIRRLSVSATQNSESAIGNFNASSSSLDAIEVKAAGAQLPASFTFNCIPYEGFDPRMFTCQIRALTDGKNVGLKFRITSLNQHIDDIGQEFKALLKKSIDVDGIGFYTGTMQYQK